MIFHSYVSSPKGIPQSLDLGHLLSRWSAPAASARSTGLQGGWRFHSALLANHEAPVITCAEIQNIKNSIFQENHGKTMQNHWKTIGGKTYRKTMRQLCKICPWIMNSPTIHSRTCESPAIVPPSSRRSRCTSRAQERAGITQVLDASLGSSSCPVTWRFQLCFTMVYSMFYSVTSWWQNWYLRNHELNASSPNKLIKIGKAAVIVSIF